MNTPALRSCCPRTAICLPGLFVVSTLVHAQDSTTSARQRLGAEFGLGLTSRVQAFSDAGIGPVATVGVRRPAQQGSSGFIASVSYALVPLTHRLPDGSANNSAHEGIYGALGVEWARGASTRVDLQWNPAIANVRRWGTQPAWRSRTPTQRALAAISLGVRWGKPEARVGYALRLHASAHPAALLGNSYPSFHVMVRP